MVDDAGEAVLFDGSRLGHRLFKQVYKQRVILDSERTAVQLNLQALADRFWSKALGVPNQGVAKGFHSTAKSIILYKKSKQLAIKVCMLRDLHDIGQFTHNSLSLCLVSVRPTLPSCGTKLSTKRVLIGLQTRERVKSEEECTPVTLWPGNSHEKRTEFRINVRLPSSTGTIVERVARQKVVVTVGSIAQHKSCPEVPFVPLAQLPGNESSKQNAA